MTATPLFKTLLVIALLFLLTACASPGRDAPVSDRSVSGLTEEELADLDRQRAEAERATEEQRAAAAPRRALEGAELDRLLDDPSSPINRRTIYFAFDSSDISESDMSIIESHARFLADHPDQRIIVEGHTDERGSASYNLALGQRRALAVTRALVLSGASESQIRTVSYGEEQPVNSASNEAAWRENRRAELVYRDLF